MDNSPIFIIGSGRSGTSILYQLLALHPQLCWFSNITNKFPNVCFLSLSHRFLDIPGIGQILKLRIIKDTSGKLKILPVEGGNIYHNFCGFKHDRKYTERDFSKKLEVNFKRVINCHLSFTGKLRFLNKQTANVQRIRLIKKIFPESYFIHIIRDGRAVANSLLKMDWWKSVDIWWLGCTPSECENKFREPIELCALHWKREIEEIFDSKNLFGKKYIEIRYEDLVKDVKENISKIIKFCRLKESKKFDKLLPTTLPNMNYKWLEDLSEKQKNIIENNIGNLLSKLNYF